MQPNRRVSVDGFARRTAPPPGVQPRPSLAQNSLAPRPMAAKKPRTRAFALPADRPRTSVWRRLQLPLIIVAGLILGFFMQTLLFGLALIALYGVLALVFKVQSRVTFVLAFLSLLTVVLLLVIKRNPEQSSNFATYTFLLLAIAVVSLVVESRQAKPHYKKH